jgi:hypothetical protein
MEPNRELERKYLVQLTSQLPHSQRESVQKYPIYLGALDDGQPSTEIFEAGS